MEQYMISIKLTNRNMSRDSFDILRCSAARRLNERGLDLSDETNSYEVFLAVDHLLSDDRYIIEPDGKTFSLTASNDCALHAAFGRLLLESGFDGRGSFAPLANKIDFTPEKPLRGMYFATHFHNFYHEAPLDEVYKVIEDLALRGCNSLLVWFDMHHYTSMLDPDAVIMTARLRSILTYANRIGISGSLIMLANEDFSGSPELLRAQWTVQGDYKRELHGHYHVEICPNKAGGTEEILRARREMISYFKDIKIDYVVYWPYDQGGCTCPACQPWGSNGFLTLLPHFRQLINEMMPGTGIILSTWLFDSFIAGEWNALHAQLSDGRLGDIEYVMSFFFNGEMPECIKNHGIPQGVSFIDFPEISMYSCNPWGGFGANPLSRFLQRTNDKCGHIYSGGYPYSEGIFEDLNKFIQLSYYTGQYKKAGDAVRAYARFEFCCSDDELSEATIRTETGLARLKTADTESYCYKIKETQDIEYVYRVFSKYNEILPDKIRLGYRFRLLYLRAVIDYELIQNNFFPLRSARCQEAMKEINTIYYATPKTNRSVCAPLGR
jgi:hypothetical protein